MTGPSRPFDPATTPARRDIADVRLAERIFAPHYAAPMLRTLARAAALTQGKSGPVVADLVAGQSFEVLEVSGDHAWGVAQPAALVGYVPLAALAAA